MNTNPPIFSGTRILSGRGAIQGRSAFAGPTHPLAGHSFALRLLPSCDDRGPVGFYQDRDCTLPATEDMDPIRGWKDEVFHSPLSAIAPTDANRAFLRIINGKPCVYFDGVNSRLEITGYPSGSRDATQILTARILRTEENQYLTTNKQANDRDSFIVGFGSENLRYWNGSSLEGSVSANCGFADTANFRCYAGVRKDTGSGAIYRGYHDGTLGEDIESSARKETGSDWIIGSGESSTTPSEMYVSSWVLRTAASTNEEIANFSNHLKTLAPANLLADIPSLLDLRTHDGNKLPLGINPTKNNVNRTWRGFTSTGTQPVETKQPLTKFAADNTPYLDFDGIDDWMSIGMMPRQATYTILIRSKTPQWNILASFLEHPGDVDSPNKWGSLQADGNIFSSNNLPTSVRVNGTAVASPFAVPDPSSWNVITVRTAISPAGVERGIFTLENRFFLSAQIIGLFIHDGDPTTIQIQTVEDHFMTLKPDPDVVAYIDATGAEDAANISAWVKGLKALKLWEQIDFWLYQSDQNYGEGTAVKCAGGLGLGDATISNLSDVNWTAEGLQFVGSAFNGYVDLPDLRSHFDGGFSFFSAVNNVNEDNFYAPDVRSTDDQYFASMTFNQSNAYPGVIPNVTRAGTTSYPSPPPGPVPSPGFNSGATVFGYTYQRGYHNGELRSNQTGLPTPNASGSVSYTRTRRGNGSMGIKCQLQCFIAIPLSDAEVASLHHLYRATIGRATIGRIMNNDTLSFTIETGTTDIETINA